MARFSMIPAGLEFQFLDKKVVYCLKDNQDSESPIREWLGTEEKCKEMVKWLNKNLKDSEEKDDFNFLGATTFEKVERLEEKLGCSVELNNASINNTYLIKLDKPIPSLRDKVADALNINYDSISIYNSTMWGKDDYYGGDDIAIINRSKI